jgi:hypothetical protein
MWVGRDGGDLLFSTVEGRVKHRNMLHRPGAVRVAVRMVVERAAGSAAHPG